MLSRLTIAVIALLVFSFVAGANAQEYSPVKGWKYLPQDEGFWEKVQELQKSGKSGEAFEFLFDHISSKTDISKAAGAELYLALADSLQSASLSQASFNIYLQILKLHPGSAMAQKALSEIDKLVPSGSYDEEELARVINQAAFLDVPEGVESMMFFYTAMDDMKKGLYRWSEKGTNKISDEGYWGYRFRYLKALELYRRGQIGAAEKELKLLLEKKDLPASLIWRIQLQRARIFVELRDFEMAEKAYTAVDFPPRLFGRVLLERAWVKYYQRDFASALGLLESLKAPAFRIFSDPEQTILAMLIYREICYYPEVVRLSLEFRKLYQLTYDLIKKGKPFSDSPALMWMTLQKPIFRDAADVVDAIQKEKQNAHKVLSAFLKKPGAAFLMKAYDDNEQEMRGRIEHAMQGDLRKKADDFLTSWDQVKLLEYISKLDEYRIKQVFESRSYEAPKADTRTFDVLYWPVMGEYWSEEFKNYRVILSDRCEGPEKGGKR